MLQGKWLEDLYPEPSQLMPGQEVNRPWQRKGGRVENLKAIVVSENDVKKQKLRASHKQQTVPRKQLQTAAKKTGTRKKKGLFLQANVSNLSILYR